MSFSLGSSLPLVINFSVSARVNLLCFPGISHAHGFLVDDLYLIVFIQLITPCEKVYRDDLVANLCS